MTTFKQWTAYYIITVLVYFNDYWKMRVFPILLPPVWILLSPLNNIRQRRAKSQINVLLSEITQFIFCKVEVKVKLQKET